MNKTAKLGIGNILMSHQRYQVVNYLYPLNSIDIVFFTGKPNKESASLNVLKPFHFKVWILTISTLVIVTALGFVFVKLITGKIQDFAMLATMPLGTLSNQSKLSTLMYSLMS